MSPIPERTSLLVPVLLTTLMLIIVASLLALFYSDSNENLCQESKLGSSFIELLAEEKELAPEFKECRGPFSSNELAVGSLFDVSLNRVQRSPKVERIHLVEKSQQTDESDGNERNVDLYRASLCILPPSGLSPSLPMLIKTYVLAGDESIDTGDPLNINPRPTGDSDCRLNQSSTRPGRESSFLFELPSGYRGDKVVFGIMPYNDLLLFQTHKPTEVPN